MNKDQQKTVIEMLDAMELDTYGERGLKEIIRQMAVEIVKRSAPPKQEPLSVSRIEHYLERQGASFKWDDGFEAGVKWAEKCHGIGGKE